MADKLWHAFGQQGTFVYYKRLATDALVNPSLGGLYKHSFKQLELSSIDVYLDDIPQETKILIKKELSNKIFGQAGETYKSKYDDNTNETLDKVVKLVENLSHTITKK